LLFIAFINDLPLHVSSAQIDLYADDTKLTCTANFDSVGVLQSLLTTAISEVDQWATANKPPLNESKKKCLPLLASDFLPELNITLLLLLMESNWRMFAVQSFWV